MIPRRVIERVGVQHCTAVVIAFCAVAVGVFFDVNQVRRG
jgi:hypothetical protein